MPAAWREVLGAAAEIGDLIFQHTDECSVIGLILQEEQPGVPTVSLSALSDFNDFCLFSTI